MSVNIWENYKTKTLSKPFLNWFTTILLTCFAGFFNIIYAQIEITSPVNNQVMQRDTLGFARIQITAYSYFPYQRIEAKLTALPGNPHTQVTTNFDIDQLSEGFLHTTIRAESGWYKLTLTGFSPNGFIDSTIVPRVGVGEVFLIAGNSNAMGLPDLGAKSATDNVITFNGTNKILNKENITVAPDLPMPAPKFSTIEAKSSLFPTGETSWYWGELGDMLSKKLNVPILFLNAAWAAANSENYRDGAMGKDAYNLYVGKNWPNRQPYSNIKNTLRYYNSWLGIRAVFWAHGENDAQHGFTEEAYFNNIKTLIDNSRRDAGYLSPWILARSSAGEVYPRPYQPVIDAQNRLFAIKNYQAYLGPNLDSVQIPRPKHGHFENINGGLQGLTMAATAWNRTLTDSFLKKSVPVQPKYVIHTGVTPSELKPGSSFLLPYTVAGSALTSIPVHAELLNDAGEFVDTVGVGNKTPLTITLPQNLKSGKYRLRVTGSMPIMPGSVSTAIYVNEATAHNQYLNRLEARKEGQLIHISWLVSANPDLRKMVLQKTTNGENYMDVSSIEAMDNEANSRIYSYADQNSGEGSIFYRVILEFSNGEIRFSPIATVFQNGAPPHFLVFPNPVTSQQFHLRSDTENQILECRLYDISGKEHRLTTNDREMAGTITARPISHLPAGNYILRITSDLGTSSQIILFR
ncbi:T9SS type A sorting domain-containing protein [Dyadobacter sp. CY312]|uniref:T9SS type A sorting domain-containing protein n=1 Tax=Dyadobacter sp. CY312 TaxID=2907303 RepID=UPI001F191B1A|nr:T9SS type A sorting domain-containing protein [Dyadobacter sp. CY312]MCE7041023.1 T9SS type A sorting domain-containing protein [Dyadobacter sp. CY312]